MKFNGRNIYIGKNVHLGKGVRIGDNTTIYDNVSIGDGSVICDNCSLGEPLQRYYSDDSYVNPELRIGENCFIRSHAVIYAGASIGASTQIAHWALIRENTVLGEYCMVGVHVHILDGCQIGSYVRFHSYNTIGENSEIGDFVFFYPLAVITTDPNPPSNLLLRCRIGKYTQVATSSVLMPGVEIGEHCLVAAQSKVAGKFADYSLIAGSPAKNIVDLREAPIINQETGKRQYPWPYNFSRNMPWEGIGYDTWLKNQENI